MELDIIKLQTTWNDAAGSLNNNFAKIQQAINTGSGGGGGVAGGGIYEIKYDFLNGNPLSEEDIAFNAEVFDKLSRNEVSALYVVVDDGGDVRFVADSFYYMPPVDGEGVSAVLLNFTAETLSLMGLPQRVIQIGSDGSAEEIPLSGSGVSIVHLSKPDDIARFYSKNPEASLLSTLIVDDIDNAVNPLVGRIVDFSSGYITYSCSNGDVRRVTFNSDYTIKKRGLIEGVIYLGDNLTDFQKQANLAYATAMKDLNDYDYSNGNKKRVGVVVYYNGDFYNALIFDKSGIVILAGLELQGWIIDEAGNTTLTESINIGGADIDTSKFATTAQLQELDNILSDEIDGLKDSKQNTISDLDAIRSGAALGATALQEHQDISHLATKSEVNSKQDTLVSGTNIKTINGESILGEGNLTIQGGNGSYDDTEIRNELSKKADVSGVYPEMTVGMTRDMLGVGEGDEGEFLFRPTDGDGSIKDGFASIERIEGNSVVWNQSGNKTIIDKTIGAGTLGYDVVSTQKTKSGHYYYLAANYSSQGEAASVYFGNVWKYAIDVSNKPIILQTENNNLEIALCVRANNDEVLTYSAKPQVVDLTRMFGEGNEPTTIEEFYQRIPSGIDEYAYNEGEVVNMNVEGIKSVGFNAWDEQWENGTFNTTTGENINHEYVDSTQIRSKNLIPVVSNASYYVTIPSSSIWIIFYDKDGQVITDVRNSLGSIDGNSINTQNNYTFLTPNNATSMKFYAEGSYGANYKNDICIHLVHTGYRNGEYEPYVSDEIALPIIEYFPSGMKAIGNVRDEITATQAIQRIGAVDMGTLDYYSDNRHNNPQYYMVLPQMKAMSGVLCEKYTTIEGGWDTNVDKTVLCLSGNNVLFVDSSYTDAASFKAAMSGVMLYYELAEPIVTTFDKQINLDYQVWDFGTEEALAEGKTTPLKASIIYEFNARDTIRANKLALKNKADKAYVDNAIAQAIISTLNTEV